jgi:dipeptidase D
MSHILAHLEPKALWQHFEALTQIPRPSKHEAKVIDYVVQFGKANNLETIVDSVGNVIIRKPATPGMENRKGIVLQGHLDMVPQANSDKIFDFTKDPIEPMIEGNWVTANGTTLGADNGIGVAATLAVLESKTLVHGPLEALFTIDEETGMTGAFALTGDQLQGEILINLDSEDEGELYIGCAGGMDTNVSMTLQRETTPSGHCGLTVTIKGLKGGHSGCDIHLERGNANKILNRILWSTPAEIPFRLSSFKGGTLRNAIPREAVAVITLAEAQVEAFEEHVQRISDLLKAELTLRDPQLQIFCGPCECPDSVMDEATQRHLLNAIYACPNGVYAFTPDMPDVVETSNNLAIVDTQEHQITIGTLQRSSVDSAKEDLAAMIRSVFQLAQATDIRHEGAYPGWKPNLSSPILATMKKQYQDLFGVIPEVKVIHAGLECGIIGDVFPQMDCISFGPTIRFPHSPDERVDIETVGKFWKFLVNTLSDAPLKGH